jgi:hypothetical protein
MIINARFQFNPGLLNETFDMVKSKPGTSRFGTKEFQRRVSNFAKHCSKITIPFPELKGYRPGKDIARITKIKNRICTDPVLVRENL